MLQQSRAQTLRVMEAWAHALPDLQVPRREELNPPLWEAGHVGWFQEWWLRRNPQRARGPQADPDCHRAPSRMGGADRLFDSSRVAHDVRWRLPLPGLAMTRDFLAHGLDDTLALLRREDGDGVRYFARLALFHEDMHGEAALYMTHGLGFTTPDSPPPLASMPLATPLRFDAASHRLGTTIDGFAFDNELVGEEAALAPFEIDATPLSNRRYLEFLESGGYADARCWSPEGLAWRGDRRAPRHWRREDDGWQRSWFGRWLAIEPDAPACNLSCHEAEAWCRWAGRRLPSEVEWEHAALTAGVEFHWGQVWEWTASAFRPYAGFVAHPYRDYSEPWFGARRVLRGASCITHPRLRHRKYRNFFTPDRNDIFAGFRSCAL